MPVFAELPADLDTPLSAYLRLRPGPYSFLLESVEGGEVWARYSFLGPDPLWSSAPRTAGSRSTRHGPTRAAAGRQSRSRRCASCSPTSSPSPCRGCPDSRAAPSAISPTTWSGTWSGCRADAEDDLGLPDAVFMFSDTLLVFDNLRHRLLVIANAHDRAARPGVARPRVRPGGRAHRDDAGQARAAGAVGHAPLTLPAPGPLLALGEEGFTSTMDEATFSDAVRRAKEYIAAGDAYQVVLARRLDCRAGGRSVHGLPGAADDQPVAVPLLSSAGPDHDRRLLAGGAGAGRGRSGRGAADRRHPPARRHRGRGPGDRADDEDRPEGAGRARHAGRPRPQRRGPGVRAGLGQGHRVHGDRAVLARHAPGQPRASARSSAGADAFDVLRGLLPGRDRDGRAEDPRHGDHRRARADPARPLRAAPSATSRTPATSTPASRSGRSCATAAARRSRSAPASWPTRIPKTEWLETCSKARGLVLALRIAATAGRP